MIISINMIIALVCCAMLIVSSIHDTVHKKSYYYAGGTYLVKQENLGGKKN